MIIIVEGLDRCGKTSIISLIKNYYIDYPVHIITNAKFNIKDNYENQEYMVRLYNDLIRVLNFHSKNRVFIVDRAYLSEYVYSQIYRGNTKERAERVFFCENLITNKDNAYLITLVDSNVQNLLERDDKQSLSDGDIDKVKKEMELFTEAHNKSTIKNKLLLDIKSTKDKQADEQFKLASIRKFLGV